MMYRRQTSKIELKTKDMPRIHKWRGLGHGAYECIVCGVYAADDVYDLLKEQECADAKHIWTTLKK